MTGEDADDDELEDADLDDSPPVVGSANGGKYVPHLPHGSWGGSFPKATARKFAKQLAETYGWSLDWFGLKSG